MDCLKINLLGLLKLTSGRFLNKDNTFAESILEGRCFDKTRKSYVRGCICYCWSRDSRCDLCTHGAFENWVTLANVQFVARKCSLVCSFWQISTMEEVSLPSRGNVLRSYGPLVWGNWSTWLSLELNVKSHRCGCGRKCNWSPSLNLIPLDGALALAHENCFLLTSNSWMINYPVLNSFGSMHRLGILIQPSKESWTCPSIELWCLHLIGNLLCQPEFSRLWGFKAGNAFTLL